MVRPINHLLGAGGSPLDQEQGERDETKRN
jgi:hypothetical protein